MLQVSCRRTSWPRHKKLESPESTAPNDSLTGQKIRLPEQQRGKHVVATVQAKPEPIFSFFEYLDPNLWHDETQACEVPTQHALTYNDSDSSDTGLTSDTDYRNCFVKKEVIGAKRSLRAGELPILPDGLCAAINEQPRAPSILASIAWPSKKRKHFPVFIIVDSGADQTIAGKELLDGVLPEGWEESLQPTTLVLYSATGHEPQVYGVIHVLLRFYDADGIETFDFTHPVVVSDNSSGIFLLGNEFIGKS